MARGALHGFELKMQSVLKHAGALGLALALASTSALSADSARSFKAEVLFRLNNPCPTTGETRGECRGYVIDRIIPQACGGTEDPSNMQWQTIAEAKAKDRWERIGCRPGRKLVMPGEPTYTEAYPIDQPTGATEAVPLPPR
jgi:hypothetical protein